MDLHQADMMLRLSIEKVVHGNQSLQMFGISGWCRAVTIEGWHLIDEIQTINCEWGSHTSVHNFVSNAGTVISHL